MATGCGEAAAGGCRAKSRQACDMEALGGGVFFRFREVWGVGCRVGGLGKSLN